MPIKYWAVVVLMGLGLVSPVAAQTTAIELPPLCPSASAPDALPPATALKVLTTFTVIADMARNVACDKLIVESLTKVGAEIHHYEPTPSDITKAQDADLILYNGLKLELWFTKFLGAVNNVPSANLTDGLTPLLIAEGAYKDLPNPHAWMSPKTALLYVENIRLAFIALDPTNTDAYNANALAYSTHIEAIDAFLRDNLAQLPSNQRTIVSCEGAFSYLAHDYNMRELYLWAVNADQQGTPKQVAHLIDEVKANQIPAVFCETTVNNEPQLVVAEDTGANFGGALYTDSLSELTGPVPTYLDLLRYDATTIVAGLLGK